MMIREVYFCLVFEEENKNKKKRRQTQQLSLSMGTGGVEGGSLGGGGH